MNPSTAGRFGGVHCRGAMMESLVRCCMGPEAGMEIADNPDGKVSDHVFHTRKIAGSQGVFKMVLWLKIGEIFPQN